MYNMKVIHFKYYYKFFYIAVLCVLASNSRGNSNDLGYINDSIFFRTDLGVGYDSNLYDSSSIKRDSLILQPSFKLGINAGKETLVFLSDYEYSLFIPEYNDDLAKFSALNVNAYWLPSKRNKYIALAQFEQSDEKRGLELSENDLFSIDGLDHYEDSRIGLGYSFNSSVKDSLFLDLNYLNYSRIYESTRAVALNANLESVNLNISLGYVWDDDKKLYIELKEINNIYKGISDGSKDSDHKIQLFGVNWLLSPQSDFSFEIGVDEKQFDIGNERINTDYWSLFITWRPLSHSEFSLQSKNEQEPSTGVNETSNEISSLSLSWNHGWGFGYKTAIIMSQIIDESVVSGIAEEEENLLLSIKGLYRDFEVSVDLEKTTSTSTVDSFSQISLLFIYHFDGGL